MAILEIARGQNISIPAIHLTNGKIFTGVVRAGDGESLMIDLHEGVPGDLPPHLDDMCVITWEVEGVRRSCPVVVRSNTPRSMVAQVVIQERREAPRLRVDMQLCYIKVPPEKVKETAEEVMARINTLAEPVGESIEILRKGENAIEDLRHQMAQMREMMGEILARLDTLTAAVAGRHVVESTQSAPLLISNVSSTGVGFVGVEPLQAGDYLRVHMEVYSTPRTVIDCMGVVVRCLKLEDAPTGTGSRYDVGIRFTHIHESDRERLIHHLFKLQRRMLRDLKEARMALAEAD